MTNVYGSLLLRSIPQEAVETEAQCLALLEQFARQGFCEVFREIVKDRVVEVRMLDGEPTYRWLEGDEAETVLSLRGIGGWAPYSLFSFLDGIGTVFTPNGHRKGDAKLTLDVGSPFEMYVLPAASAISAITSINNRLKKREASSWETADYPLEMYLELHNSLIEGLKACQKAGVIYRF